MNTIMAQNTEIIKNDKVTLNVATYSNNKTETIILLHGGPGVPDNMLEIVEKLKKKYRIITFEQRGVGLSECNGCGYTMKDYISDIEAIRVKLNINKFHLFGHSWGGLYAQIYASEKPERINSLFLCSPSSGTNDTWKKTEKEVMKFNKGVTSTGEWLNMGWNSLLGMMGSSKAYRKIFSQVLNNYNKAYGSVIIEDDFLEKIHAKPINETRKEIIKYSPLKIFTKPNYPIIITYGENDIYGESKNELLRRFPTAKVQTIEKCGHIPWKNNPNEFNKLLKLFYINTK